MTSKFSSVLIANRGEIARRVIRSAKSLGLRTIAVASEADAHAPHTREADERVIIGPAPVGESYLNQEAILNAAQQTGAEAIHPGYGFLSENAGFAKAVRDAGLVLVGPSPEAIDLMGDKARAKRAMKDAGVPLIPGYEAEDQDDQRFIEAAEKAGYPVMVKAAAGGGGRGMRRVVGPQDLPAALVDARAEALSAFGSSDLILEKAVENARHVEIQVFGDAHGNVLHLGERDCSLQRRHQKVIEEAPSPAVSEALRSEMGEAAVRAARAVNYQGAGTVEFLLASDGAFFFLEMNTRLQVEHPVTEEVLGLDLVAMQFRVAQGLPLGIAQSDIVLCGHAIQARLYAEDPDQGFLPSTGPIALWSPASSVRVDDGIETGGAVSPHYDPMVAKIIAHGQSREEARRLLINALESTSLIGPSNNRGFLLELLKDPIFVDGEATTGLIDGRAGPEARHPDETVFAAATVLQHLEGANANTPQEAVPPELSFFQLGHPLPTPYGYVAGDEVHRCEVTGGPGVFTVMAGDRTHRVEVLDRARNRATLCIDGSTQDIKYVVNGATISLSTAEADHHLTNHFAERASDGEAGGEGAVTAPMHGLVTEVFAVEGEPVQKGQRLALLEAMKMQHEVKAPIAGTISRAPAKAGAQVAGGDLLIEIIPGTEEE